MQKGQVLAGGNSLGRWVDPLCCQPFSAFAAPLTPSVRNSSDHSSCLGIGEEFLARFLSDHLIQVHASLGVIYVSRIQTAKGSSYEWEPQEPDPFDQRPAVLRERAAP